MKNFFFNIILFIISTNVSSQEFITLEKDTLKFTSRSGSSKNDSIDLLFTSALSLNAGGYLFHPFGVNLSNYANFFSAFSSPFSPKRSFKTIYTTLPHLGFSYSFGSKGVQFMHTDFQILLKKHTLLNFNFEVNALGEMLRNGTYRNSVIDLRFLHQKNRVKNNFDFQFQQNKINLNGGLQDTSLVNSFPTELLDVRKTAAFSKQIQTELKNQFAYNLLKDSTRFIGLTLKNSWSIQNRIFEENGVLSSLYSTINIDSTQTRDQFQVATLGSGIGTYLHFKNFSSEIILQHTYWDYQNLARHNDTNEVALFTSNALKIKNLLLKNDFTFNIVGALGQFSERLHISYKLPKLHFHFTYLFENKLPNIPQRNYFANNTIWQLSNLSLQQQQELKFAASYLGKVSANFSVSYKNWSNTYLYLNQEWRNDTLTSIQLLNICGKLAYKFKAIGIQPMAQVNFTSKNIRFIPNYDLRLRLFFNKKVFKSKKLDYLLGVDVSYLSDYTYMNFLPNVGLNEFANHPQTNTDPILGLDFFTGFEINVFRFYLRMENIDYLWTQKAKWVLNSYPATPMFFRFGVTWDFFN